MVALHGTDLLAKAKALRHRIADQAGAKRLERFHPGSTAAHALVHGAGLPQDLAGEPEAKRPRAVLRITSYRRLPDLVDYQTTGKEQMLGVIHDGSAAIYSVPTGAGKTRTVWEAVYDFVAARAAKRDSPGEEGTRGNRTSAKACNERNVIVWLAHHNELLDQTCACLKDVWHSRQGNVTARLVRLWGRNTHDALERLKKLDPPAWESTSCMVIVSTPATMAAVLDKLDHAPLLRTVLIERTCAIVVDEAHRAAAPSYVRIAQWLRRPGRASETDSGETSERRVALLGLTATPFRETTSASDGTEETLELKKIFGRLLVPGELGSDPQRMLVEQGILARPVFEDLPTGVDVNIESQVKRFLAKRMKVRGVKSSNVISARGEELIDRWLAAQASAVRSPKRHSRILEIVLQQARDSHARILYFGHSVANAQRMCVSLLEAGIPAGVVSGATRRGTRRALIEDFGAGRIRVLCNCEVLTAGFDAPLVTHVVVARPTVSVVLYQQMIGRGLRGPKFGGTERCVIVNCIDRVKIGPLVMAHRRFRDLWERVTDDA